MHPLSNKPEFWNSQDLWNEGEQLRNYPKKCISVNKRERLVNSAKQSCFSLTLWVQLLCPSKPTLHTHTHTHTPQCQPFIHINSFCYCTPITRKSPIFFCLHCCCLLACILKSSLSFLKSRLSVAAGTEHSSLSFLLKMSHGPSII